MNPLSLLFERERKRERESELVASGFIARERESRVIISWLHGLRELFACVITLITYIICFTPILYIFFLVTHSGNL